MMNLYVIFPLLYIFFTTSAIAHNKEEGIFQIYMCEGQAINHVSPSFTDSNDRQGKIIQHKSYFGFYPAETIGKTGRDFLNFRHKPVLGIVVDELTRGWTEESIHRCSSITYGLENINVTALRDFVRFYQQQTIACLELSRSINTASQSAFKNFTKVYEKDPACYEVRYSLVGSNCVDFSQKLYNKIGLNGTLTEAFFMQDEGLALTYRYRNANFSSENFSLANSSSWPPSLDIFNIASAYAYYSVESSTYDLFVKWAFEYYGLPIVAFVYLIFDIIRYAKSCAQYLYHWKRD